MLSNRHKERHVTTTTIEIMPNTWDIQHFARPIAFRNGKPRPAFFLINCLTQRRAQLDPPQHASRDGPKAGRCRSPAAFAPSQQQRRRRHLPVLEQAVRATAVVGSVRQATCSALCARAAPQRANTNGVISPDTFFWHGIDVSGSGADYRYGINCRRRWLLGR